MMRDLIRYAAGLAAAAAGAALAAGMMAAAGATGASAATAMSAVQAPLPTNAAADPEFGVLALSCVSAGKCTATGGYTDSSGNKQGSRTP